MYFKGKWYGIFAFKKCFLEQVENLIVLIANIFITLHYTKWEQGRKYLKCSQAFLTTITSGPHSCHIPCLCQNPTNNTSNQVLEMVIYTTMPLLRFSPLPSYFSAVLPVFLFLLHISCTWIPQWRLWVPWNVCFRGPSPDCQGTQTLAFCQNYISKPWVQSWRKIKALSTQLSLEYFLYASHLLVSANNIFPKRTGLRWYKSAIIWMGELSGPVLLKDKQKGTALKMQNNNKPLPWSHGKRSRKDLALWARETQYPGCTIYPFERRRITGSPGQTLCALISIQILKQVAFQLTSSVHKWKTYSPGLLPGPLMGAVWLQRMVLDTCR